MPPVTNTSITFRPQCQRPANLVLAGRNINSERPLPRSHTRSPFGDPDIKSKSWLKHSSFFKTDNSRIYLGKFFRELKTAPRKFRMHLIANHVVPSSRNSHKLEIANPTTGILEPLRSDANGGSNYVILIHRHV